MQVAGIQIGTVVNNNDPDQQGRIQVSFPAFDGTSSSSWAQVVVPLAGNAYGVYMLPEVGDQVIVAFQNNNFDHPVVLGGVYSGSGKQSDTNDSNNYIKNIKTKAGNEIRFIDKPGSEQITITNKTSNDNQVILTVEDSGKITITSNGKIELTAPDIKLSANDHLDICGGQVSITGSKIAIHSDGQMIVDGEKTEISGSTEVDVSAPQVQITANTQLTVDGGQTATIKSMLSMTVQSTGETAIKGGMVMIN